MGNWKTVDDMKEVSLTGSPFKHLRHIKNRNGSVIVWYLA